MLLRPTLSKYDVRFATTDAALPRQRSISQFHILPDCNKDRPVSSVWCAFVAFWIVLKVRPHIVLSTGAAPGFFCVLAGRLVGARTLWIDSVANAEQLSMCGKLSKIFAHECWTQWEHLSGPEKPRFFGAVL